MAQLLLIIQKTWDYCLKPKAKLLLLKDWFSYFSNV